MKVLSLWFLIFLVGTFGVPALSAFNDGNMPAIQLIPQGGLKSRHSHEGWIVVWSR